MEIKIKIHTPQHPTSQTPTAVLIF